jgi:hypothetical protein
MKQKLLILVLWCFCAYQSQGQAQPAAKPAAQPATQPATKPAAQPAAQTASTTSPSNSETKICTDKGLGLGVNLSTNGIGLQLAHTLTKSGNLAARVEGRYLAVKRENLEVDLDGTKLVADINAKVGSIGVMLDWHPFNNAFKITGGFAMLLNDIQANAITKDSTKQGDIMIPPDEVGVITFGLKAKASPYIGIGFGRAIPKTRFGFTFEVGSFYTGAQDVTFKATGMLEPSSSNEAVLQDNLSGLTWWPVMNFGFNFRLTK